MATRIAASLAVTQPGTSEFPPPRTSTRSVSRRPRRPTLGSGTPPRRRRRPAQHPACLSDDERRLLRERFGIEKPARLYLSDTLPGASLTYDSDWDRGERHLVSSYRVGHWIAFRRWVLATWGSEFRLIGAADRSWDWPHIE